MKQHDPLSKEAMERFKYLGDKFCHAKIDDLHLEEEINEYLDMEAYYHLHSISTGIHMMRYGLLPTKPQPNL